MATDPLLDFIKAERAKGVPDETIRIMLTSNGWSSHEIGQAFVYLDDTPPVPVYSSSGPRKKWVLWLLPLMVIIGIGAWLMFR